MTVLLVYIVVVYIIIVNNVLSEIGFATIVNLNHFHDLCAVHYHLLCACACSSMQLPIYMHIQNGVHACAGVDCVPIIMKDH